MEAQRDEATGPGSHNWEEAQPEFKAKATGPQGLCGITALDCRGIFVCFCPSALERQQGGGGRLDDPSENRYPPHLAVPPASQAGARPLPSCLPMLRRRWNQRAV